MTNGVRCCHANSRRNCRSMAEERIPDKELLQLVMPAIASLLPSR